MWNLLMKNSTLSRIPDGSIPSIQGILLLTSAFLTISTRRIIKVFIREYDSHFERENNGFLSTVVKGFCVI